ncbi:Mg2+ transporter like zinc transport [Fusarium subglutinans]|uniref:Mg2+ transporter like zinc transport n=1 Tax=Gibberella subglutinans TaxID=42677 RepID=A0A8H5Q2Y4_GIBSU|nr:Mg2+ transporter like zinc transport [Fusarium subglutinans]KAF5606606.1 Mg2+ transporter like zinc transport [Fusarium subglutinans]
MATSSSEEPATSFARSLEQTKKRNTYHSFGHEGVTATVGASGRLMQMSRHFPDQRVGFCVDHRFVPEPFMVFKRAERLHSWAADPSLRTAIDPILFPSSSWSEPSSIKYVLNRWPVFTRKRKDGMEVTIQYVAFDATIYQIFDFFRDPCYGRTYSPTLLMKDGLLIRDLDFTNPDNTYNEAGEADEAYNSRNEQDRFIREHKLDSTAKDKPNSNHENLVVLSISCIQDGKMLKFDDQATDDYNYYKIRWNELALRNFEKTGKLKAILAYKLDLVPQGGILPSVSIHDVSTAEEQLALADFRGHALTGATYLDTIMNRNLEHILSVCSIPVTLQKTGKSAIAFTCGDIDGHRVATAASFYCFQFLLLAWRRFDPEKPPQGCNESQLSYISAMRNRIEKACKGHLIWLFERGEKPSNFLSPHRWVNGESIESWEDNEYLPTKALVDSPFQIIKAGDFYETFKYIDPSVKEGNGDTDDFYFTDHALIWRAARSAEVLGLRNELKAPTDILNKKASQKQGRAGRHLSNHQPGQKHGKPKFYFADVVQSNILKRFTTENPVSKRRMIAVSRSPAHTRFLLRTKDASLFHAMNLGLFNKPGTEPRNWSSMVDVWKNTIDCQTAHEDDDDLWEEPLRFALATVIAYHHKAINQRPPKDMHDHAINVLLQSASVNGLIPGRLDENNEPALYESEFSEFMRDTYWGVTFEVPYLLWRFFWPADVENFPFRSEEITEPTGVGKLQPATLGNNTHIPPTGPAELQVAVKMAAYPRSKSMKRTFPFNNMVDQDNIVVLGDEWLYNEPTFFVSSKKVVPDDNHDIRNGLLSRDDVHGDANSRENATVSQRADTAKEFDPETDMKKYLENENSDDLIDDLEYKWEEILNHWGQIDDSTTGASPPEFLGVLVDVPKSKHLKKNTRGLRESIQKITTREFLKKQMENGRTPEKAKKRFWAFFAKEPSANEICRATSALYYTTLNCNQEEQAEQAEADDKELSEVAMSFRFDGDFFDRYWTCWFLEADPGTKTTKDSIVDNVEGLLEEELKKKKGVDLKRQPWRQRRILELLLFDKIISQMHSYANGILEQAKSGIKKKTKAPAKASQRSREETDELDYDEFVKQRKRFGKFQDALQAVQDDRNENLNIVDRWLEREKDRQAERPRWTFNDESRYRSIISKMVVCNEHNIQELKRSHNNIKSFNDLLTNRVETMRNDVEQRRADDIQRFTYVTVVFLPLGFATGVFSMSEAPAGRTLGYMILVAFGALLAIGILLENMKIAETLYKLVSHTILRAVDVGFNLVTDGYGCLEKVWRKIIVKYGHLVEVWRACMEAIRQWCNERVRRPDAEEGTTEDGTPIESHD